MDRVTTRVAIALGSNLGDRRGHLEWALEQLATLLADIVASRAIETDPVGVPDEQPPFLNAAVVGTTTLGPADLLATLHDLERRSGRERPYRWAPRTLDLDLIFYGDLICDERGLTLPHPRFRGRAFVLQPLSEIAPDFVDPVTGKSVAVLLLGLA